MGRLGALAVVGLSSGCIATAGVGIGPTFDTLGGVGVEAQLRLGYGLGNVLPTPSLPLSGRIGGGTEHVTQVPYLLLGFDVPLTLGRGGHEDVLFRVGAGGTGRMYSDGARLFGPSVFFSASGVLYNTMSQGGSHSLPHGHLLALGGELRFDYLLGSLPNRAVFSLPVVLDFYSLCLFWYCS